MKTISIRKIEFLQNSLSTTVAVFMLCVLPIVVNNGYFDINTIKVTVFIKIMPWLAGAYLIMCVFNKKWPYRRFQERKVPFIFLGVLMISWLLSVIHAGFTSAVLLGNEGRYAGFFFLSCCALGCFCIASGKTFERLLSFAIPVTGSFIAMLGFLNMLGMDPLHFYTDLVKEQRLAFLSTIGNINFYGCGLLVSLSVAASMWVCGKHAVFGLCNAVIIGIGIFCSITDTALIGIVCSGPILFYMMWGNTKAMHHAILYSMVCILLIPLTQQILLYNSKLYIEFPGLFAFMAKWFVWLPLLLFLGIVDYIVVHRVHKFQERPKIWALLLFFLLAGILILGTGMTIGKLHINGEPFNEDEPAKLNFFELWGKRGFIYYASLRCFRNFSWDQKVFGCGVDNLRSVIEPYLYYSDRRMFKPGDYLNDVHNQPLQYLLTCGIIGCIAYTGFYICILLIMCRKRETTSLSNGVLLYLLLNLPGFLLNVAQPILLIFFFGAAGIGLSCIYETNESIPHSKDAVGKIIPCE